MNDCFWILEDGTIVIPDSLHILAIVSCPELFGESDRSIKNTFKRYHQQTSSNVESIAREEILLRVIKRNHIRIRKNILKRQQHWSLQLFELTPERKTSISAWAKYVCGLSGDKYADIIIHQLYDNSKMKTSLVLLAGGCTADIDPVIVTQVELLRIYK